jgi:hypothetical protein
MDRAASTLVVVSGAVANADHQEKWWKGLDSNQCTLTRADLQSAAFNHSATLPSGSRRTVVRHMLHDAGTVQAAGQAAVQRRRSDEEGGS